ncbi:MAG: helix-turn-helix domain-containing protein [Defluviitaleaceae bacterium]|nr:helix-turn-helix domain-containing protein [Defluviitaleaceae bacterium]MCL2274907.1 helix-turn-helix domain-containing protein [Defluviitaleaceae bacterium]
MRKLKELREKRRLSQVGLALKLSISQSTISAYEVGERTPDLETLICIAQFFNVSIDYLVGLSEAKKHLSKSDLSPDELELLTKYQQAKPHNRELINAYMDGLLSK